MGVKVTPAVSARSLKGPRYVADPIGDVVLPMLAANCDAILRIAREMREVETYPSPTRTNRASRIMATFANRFAKPSLGG